MQFGGTIAGDFIHLVEAGRHANIELFGVSLQIWDNIYMAKPLRDLSFRCAPIRETRRTDIDDGYPILQNRSASRRFSGAIRNSFTLCPPTPRAGVRVRKSLTSRRTIGNFRAMVA
ncbi:hypothetical protein OHD62_33985 [Mesorhizobium sp. YC-39]|uniref:hypothetical protein n=1 Tax=unclassified Mesorhizobium TaxID=325217 RepID=UPI0021E89F60|nr:MULTISPECIES: hypothetical protein [unclassified Mesorhizobium]MCV3211593.1 hypothetical protein [Mesorhizobium sp. YC-2]MCV3233357.1 hypothetical protein [Mesorhizobium sp. YC-39]